MVLIYLVYPNVRLRPQGKISSGLFRIDWVGAFLNVATLVLFDAACIFSGSTLSWHSGVIAIWVMFGVFAIIFAVQQAFSLFTEPSRRILPIAAYSTRAGLLTMLCTIFSTGGYGVALYYLPLYYAFTRGDDSLQTAVHMLPYICVYIAGAIGSGIVLPIVRRYAAIYLVGGILIVSGAGAMMSVKADTSLSQTMGIGALLGFGIGLTLQLGATVFALALPPAMRMDSSIAQTYAMYMGTTVLLAIAGCIFQNIGFNHLSKALQTSSFSDKDIRDALAGLESPIWANASPEIRTAAVTAVTSSLVRIFYISVVAGALMCVTSLAMKWEALDFQAAKRKKMGNVAEQSSDGTSPQELSNK